MPSDPFFKAMNLVHRSVLTITRGRRGWRALDMPVLQLTTTGRKTGRKRSTMLTSPAQDGATLIVVASRGGDDKTPAWFLNLQHDPKVTVRLQGAPPQRMRARIATAAERAHWWPRVVADHENYAQYQTRTDREIPLVFLEPDA